MVIGSKHLLLAWALGASAAVLAAEHQHHQHQHQHQQHQQQVGESLSLDHGKQWPTDQPLRDGMAAMRQSLAAQLPAINAGKLDKPGYAKLGQQIEAQVGKIVANCKLDPRTDAMLHPLLADLLSGAAAMQGKGGNAAAGAQQVVKALNNYGRYFQHPGWQPLP
ncbi:MAG: hypothetical protein U1F55_00660 [Chitinivorax sp.]